MTLLDHLDGVMTFVHVKSILSCAAHLVDIHLLEFLELCQCSWELAGFVDVVDYDLLADAGWLHLDGYHLLDYG